MRALIKTAPGVGNLEILDVDRPAAGAGEALVRVGPSAAAPACPPKPVRRRAVR